MSLVLFCTILMMSLSSSVAGFDEQCGATGMEKIKSNDSILAIEIPQETDSLKFDVHGEQANAISHVVITTREGGRGLTAFPNEIFNIFPNVEGIFIESKVKSLAPVEWGNPINLKVLYVRCNEITEIGTLSGLNNLERLYLDYNQIAIIRRGTFVGVDELQEIILSSNQIHTIEDGAFNTPELSHLNLKKNKLTTLSDLVFSNIPKLHTINLDHNELTHIGKSLYSLQSVFSVQLKNNHIADIDIIELSKMPNLTWLNVKNNGFSFDSTKTPGLSCDNLRKLADRLKNERILQWCCEPDCID